MYVYGMGFHEIDMYLCSPNAYLEIFFSLWYKTYYVSFLGIYIYVWKLWSKKSK